MMIILLLLLIIAMGGILIKAVQLDVQRRQELIALSLQCNQLQRKIKHCGVLMDYLYRRCRY